MIIWVNHLRGVKALERIGNVHYVSKKLKYVVMYVAKERYEEAIRSLEKLNFVRHIERSYRNEIKTEYNNEVSDEKRFYSI